MEVKPVINSQLDCDTTKKGDGENPGTRSLEKIAEEIKKYEKTSDDSYLEIGRLFLEAKNRFGKKHGDWLKWLQDDVKDISICKVQRSMRVAKWVDGNEAPVPHLDFTKAYILSRLSGKDLKTFLKDKQIEGKQIEGMAKRDLQAEVSDYLRKKAGEKSSTATDTTQQQSNVSTEDDLRKRFDKIQTDVSEFASLIDTDSGVHDAFAAELCKLCQSIIQRLSPEDIENA